MKAFVSRNPVLTFISLTLGFQLAIVLIAWVMLPTGVKLHEIPDAHMIFRLRLFGPLLFAVAITACIEGGIGIRKLFASFLNWRVGPQWYLLAFTWKFLFTWIGIIIMTSLGFAEWPGWFTPEWLMPLLRNLTFVVGIAIVEETAWIKFSVTRLQEKYTALKSCMIVGLCWGSWYMPMLILGEGVPDGMPWFAFLVGMFSLTVMLGWAYNMTHSGVVLLIMQIIGNCAFFIVPVLPGWAPGPIFVVSCRMGFCVGAAIIIIWYGPKGLADRPRAKWSDPMLRAVGGIKRPLGAARNGGSPSLGRRA